MASQTPGSGAPITTDPYRQLLDEVGAFVYTTDLGGRYTYANQLVLDLLGGHPLDAVLGKSFTDFVDIGEALLACFPVAGPGRVFLDDPGLSSGNPAYRASDLLPDRHRFFKAEQVGA